MIYLLRHGETVWNREGRIQGHRDSPLTRTGIAQAEAMGQRLRREIDDIQPWAITASPLGRAWQTAAIVAEILGLAPEGVAHEPRLAEMGFGAWEGSTYQEIDEADADAWARRDADHWNFRPPGGESYGDLAQRVEAWLSPISEAARLIVVCHGGTGRAVRHNYAGLGSEVTLALSIKQDEIYRLRDGAIDVLQTDHRAGDGKTL